MTKVMVFSIMLAAMFETRRNKRYGRDSIAFEQNWIPLLMRMMYQLQERTFRVDMNYAFLVSIPKWREIFATSFQGRIGDHLICDTLKPYMNEVLYQRTFNNREGMGAQAAINQVIEDIAEASNGYTEPCRIIKWDLKCCFPNANLDNIERCFYDVIEGNSKEIASIYGEEYPAFLKWLTMVVIHCCPASHCELRTPLWLWEAHIKKEKSLFGKLRGIGAPIGRLTSQMGMGLILNDVIRWLNEDCGIRATLFMDDCVMVVPERLHQYALTLFPVIRLRLKEIGFAMNEKKFYDQPYQHGLEFLGSHIHVGRIILNDSTYLRCIGRIEEYNSIEDKIRVLDNFVSMVNSYTGLLKNRTEHRRIQRLRETIGLEWWQWIEWDDKRQCVIYQENCTRNKRLSTKYKLHIKFKKHETGREKQAA